MRPIEWDDKFLDEWRYSSSIDLDEYFLYLKEMIVSKTFSLLEVDSGGQLVLWAEEINGKKCLWIEFGCGRGLSETVLNIIKHCRSHGYEIVRTNVERVGARVLYERAGFKLTHYMMEIEI